MRCLYIYLLGALLSLGCDSRSADEPISDAGQLDVPETFEPPAIAEIVARAYCRSFSRCMSDIRLEFLRYEEYCVESIRTVLERDLMRLESSVVAGDILYDAEAMERCALAIENSTCWALDTENFEEDCARPLIGTQDAGEPCQQDSECAAGFCPGNDGCAGQCMPLSGAGESCALDGERQCEAGLDCNMDALCVPKTDLAFRAAGGERCEVVRCEPGFHCARLPNQTSVCRSTAARFNLELGATCAPRMAVHADEECAFGLLCGYEDAEQLASGGRCLEIPSLGDDCFVAREVPEVWCLPGSYCRGLDPANGQNVGQCTALPLAGQPCGEHFGTPRFCAVGHICIAGNCVVSSELGEPCLESRQCSAGACIDGRCSPVCPSPDAQ